MTTSAKRTAMTASSYIFHENVLTVAQPGLVVMSRGRNMNLSRIEFISFQSAVQMINTTNSSLFLLLLFVCLSVVKTFCPSSLVTGCWLKLSRSMLHFYRITRIPTGAIWGIESTWLVIRTQWDCNYEAVATTWNKGKQKFMISLHQQIEHHRAIIEP